MFRRLANGIHVKGAEREEPTKGANHIRGPPAGLLQSWLRARVKQVGQARVAARLARKQLRRKGRRRAWRYRVKCRPVPVEAAWHPESWQLETAVKELVPWELL